MEYVSSKGIDISKSDDGFTETQISKEGVRYIIIYNEKHSRRRIRWTIAHELGHIFLGHFEHPETSKDSEANYFAQQLLMPLAVLDKLDCCERNLISELCDVSLSSADIRLNGFQRRKNYKSSFGNTHHDIKFIKQFNEMFIHEFALEICA